MPEPILTPAMMRAIRADLGVTQAVMAVAMTRCREQYGLWERGKRPMPDYVCDAFFAAVETLRKTRAQRLARRDVLLAELPRAS